MSLDLESESEFRRGMNDCGNMFYASRYIDFYEKISLEAISIAALVVDVVVVVSLLDFFSGQIVTNKFIIIVRLLLLSHRNKFLVFFSSFRILSKTRNGTCVYGIRLGLHHNERDM
jgi:hypothetical protein